MSAYSAAVLADSPAAYYRFGETSGTVMTDASGNGHNGTYTSVGLGQQNSLVAESGDYGALFNGTSAYCTITNAPWMFNATAITVEAWIRTSVTGAYLPIWDHDEISSGNRVFQFRMNNTGKIDFLPIGGTGGVVTATSAAVVNDGNPHHVAATYDGATIKVYVDGELSGTAARAGTLLQGTADMHIGANYGAGASSPYFSGYFSGGIDEAAYYTTVLSAAQIARHYAARATTQPYINAVLADSPLMYWPLSDTNATALDYSGNARNGAFASAPSTTQGPSVLPSKVGASVDFNKNNLARIANATWMDQQTFSAEFWYNADGSNSAGSYLFARAGADGGGNATDRSFNVYMNPSGYLGYQITFTDGTYADFLVESSAAFGVNRHVALTWDGTTSTLYVNGSVVHSSTAYAGKTVRTNTTALTVGSDSYTPNYTTTMADARIAHAAFYAGALSAARVTAHYNAGSTALSTPASLGDITDTSQWNQNNVKANSLGVEATLSNSSSWCSSIISDYALPVSPSNWVASVTYSLYIGSGADSMQFGLVSGAIPKNTVYGVGTYGYGAGIYSDPSFFGFVYDVYNSQMQAWANGAQVGSGQSYAANRDAYHSWQIQYSVSGGSLTMKLLCDGNTVMTSAATTAPTFATVSLALGERNGGAGATFKAQGTPTWSPANVTGHTLTGLTANGGNNQIQASWTADLGALGYDYSLDGGTTITSTMGTAIVVGGLTNGTAYTLQVRPTAGGTVGNWASVNVTPSATGLTVYLKDAFARSDSSTSLGTPDYFGTYTVVTGTWGISGQQAYVPSGTALAKVTFPAAIDVDLSFTASNYGGGPSLLFRYVDTSNYWRAMNSNGSWQVGRIVSGSWAMNFVLTDTASATDVCRVVAVGTRIYVLLNGLLRVEIDDPWYSAATATCGLLIDGSTSGRLDNVLAQSPDLSKIPGLWVDNAPSVAAPDPSQVLAAAPGPLLPSGFAYLGHDSHLADTGAV